MDACRLNIGIRIAAERSKALREALRRVAGGDRTLQEPGLYFENVEELRSILTEKRLELLLALTRHRPAPAGIGPRIGRIAGTRLQERQHGHHAAPKARPGEARSEKRQGKSAGTDCAL